jgi:hypothetical protein
MNQVHDCDAILSFVWFIGSVYIYARYSSSEQEVLDMPNMLKSTILGVALLAGTAFAVQAQSVSSLPPGGGAPQGEQTQPPASPPTVGLSPGAGGAWKVEHQQTPGDYASNPSDHPYSAVLGPKPN